MRVAGAGIALIVVVSFAGSAAAGQSAGAQSPASAQAAAAAQAPAAEKAAPNTFSGIKLVDLHARKAEQTVTVKLHSDRMTVTDPTSKKEVASVAYAGSTVTHQVSPAPPQVAGEPAAAATQPMAPPMYMGKTPRNWLTIKSGSDTYVLRVSEHVYAQLKAALATHNVEVQETK